MAKEIGRLLTAMITPFKADGSIDFAAAERLANLLVADGSDGVVVSGTTGESPTLSDDEKVELVGVVKKAIPNHNVVAGTGSNDTHRTAVNMTAATTLRCAALPGIIGVKEASGDLDQMGLVCAGKPKSFHVWSGDDSFTLPLMAVGGYGVICVTSHLAGKSMKRLIEAHLAGENETARRIHLGLLPVIKALMTTAANPVPVKSALQAMGFPAGPFRLPLVPLSDEQLQSVVKVIREAGDLITFKTGVKVA
ncbi:MAG: 4-hydroxy-tetrahydrodipicolinate synthase [Chloroflexi bacterium]|nr:MAG: 4-hydroxy-tetrahydrodipicolinate synthase [Chloroflexota bacterium]